jgi:hypothetical protein
VPEVAQQGRVVFDPDLLGRAETVLQGRPEQPATSQVGALQIDAAAFGTVPGGAEAGARLESFVSRMRTELTAVSADVADLAGRTGQAKQLATEVNGMTQTVAHQGTPRGGSGGR